MELKGFDNKCVRIITASAEAYEGTVSYCGEEYVFHEYGRNQEALLLTPILFYPEDISSITSLEAVDGPFGHYSAEYGLLETKCLEWGTDLIEEVFESEDDIQILRMLACMNDNYQSLAKRAVPGMAPWRSGNGASKSEDGEGGPGPVYLGELETMLGNLVRHSESDVVVGATKGLLERLRPDVAEKGATGGEAAKERDVPAALLCDANHAKPSRPYVLTDDPGRAVAGLGLGHGLEDRAESDTATAAWGEDLDACPPVLE